MSLIKIQSYGGFCYDGQTWQEARCQHCEWQAFSMNGKVSIEEEIKLHRIYHLTKELADVSGGRSSLLDYGEAMYNKGYDEGRYDMSAELEGE